MAVNEVFTQTLIKVTIIEYAQNNKKNHLLRGTEKSLKAGRGRERSI